MGLLRYNPFGVERKSLTAGDLLALKRVAEGWYVEYKRQPNSPRNVAKSITSFANTSGGWLIYGVEGSKVSPHYAESFPGIPTSEVGTVITEARDAASAHSSLSPYFEVTTVDGPEESLGIPADRSIVVIEIPRGSEAPYVHSSGRIYRRVADQSDPKPETDRALLDMLWNRRQEALAKLKRRLSVPEVSKAERNQSYLHLFFMTDPYFDRGHRSQLAFREFTEFSAGSKSDLTYFPLEHSFPTTGGYVARQRVNTKLGGHPESLSLTWVYRRDCSSLFSIPLASTQDLRSMSPFFKGCEHFEKFVELLKANELEKRPVLVLPTLVIALLGVVARIRSVLEKEGLAHHPVYVKAVVTNVWRKIPFVDTQSFIDQVATFGVPILQENQIEIPRDVSTDLIPMDFFEAVSDVDSEAPNPKDVEQVRHFLQMFKLFTLVAGSLGIHQTMSEMPTDETVIERVGKESGELVQMAFRIVAAQGTVPR